MGVSQRTGVSQLIKMTLATALVLLAPLTVLAGPGERDANAGAAAVAAAQRQPDFLFGRPGLSIGVRGAFVKSRAESDIFKLTSDLLTLEKRDFNAPGIAIDLGLPINSRVDTLVGFEFSRSSAMSHYRELIDADGLEIEQTTALSQANLSGSIEFAVLPRGRAVGRHVWVPAAVTPYVGAGAGLVWYRFEQQGDFVDIVDDSIFSALLQSSGWTTGAHLFTGVDIKVARQMLLTAEARYQWADALLKDDYVDFESIDLTGLRITGGVQFMF